MGYVGTPKKQTNKKQNKEGGEGLEEMREILSTAIFTQIPNHKKRKTEKKKDIGKQYSKLNQGKLREITKCLQVDIHLTRAI